MSLISPTATQPTPRSLARVEANALQPYDLFGPRRIVLNAFIRDLKLALVDVPDFSMRALLEQRHRILVRAGLSRAARRFAIAHEIGHMVLMERHPTLAREWKKEAQEEFAHCFAVHLLIPKHKLDELTIHGASWKSARSLVHLCSALGVSTEAFLMLAQVSGWFDERDSFVVRIKYAPNRFTGVDSKLLIARAYYDRAKWFLPTNRGVERVFDEIAWLQTIVPGESTDCLEDRTVELTLQRRRARERPKFVETSISVRANAMGLEPGPGDLGRHILMVARRSV